MIGLRPPCPYRPAHLPVLSRAGWPRRWRVRCVVCGRRCPSTSLSPTLVAELIVAKSIR